MNENNSWIPPVESPTPVEPGPQPAAVGVPVSVTVGAGWTPPPKPGLIPLRPLSFGTMLSASFQVMRRNPRPTFGIALLLNGVVVALLGIIFGFLAFEAFGRISSATLAQQNDIIAGSVGSLIVSSLIPIAFSLVVTAILQGIITLEVARGTIGEKLTFAGLWQLARGRLLALIGWSFAVTGSVIVVAVAVVIVVSLIAILGGTAGIVIAILLGIVASLTFVAGYAWLATKLSLVASVLMIERTSLGGAIRRSWQLTTGFFWKTLGIQLLITVTLQAAAQVVSFPISIVIALGGGLLNPNGQTDGISTLMIVGAVLTGIVSIIFGAITTVMQSSAVALIYLDIRMRREGLDLDLTKYVEARQRGDVSVESPYLVEDVATSA